MNKSILFVTFFCMTKLTALNLSQDEVYNPPISPENTKPNPIEQFMDWFNEEKSKTGVIFARSFVLATCGEDDTPNASSMMLNSIQKDGFDFFGDTSGRKMQDIAINSKVAVVFTWLNLQRQVTMSGFVVPLSEDELQKKFQSYPRDIQLKWYASDQSQPINSRATLLDNLKDDSMAQKKDVKMPANFMGYKFVPDQIGFWAAGPNLLHSRVEYTKKKDGSWAKELLQP